MAPLADWQEVRRDSPVLGSDEITRRDAGLTVVEQVRKDRRGNFLALIFCIPALKGEPFCLSIRTKQIDLRQTAPRSAASTCALTSRGKQLALIHSIL